MKDEKWVIPVSACVAILIIVYLISIIIGVNQFDAVNLGEAALAGGIIGYIVYLLM